MTQKHATRGEEILQRTVREIGAEFKVTAKELLGTKRGKEDLFQLLAISMTLELSGLPLSMIAKTFGQRLSVTFLSAPRRLEKYRRHIPGLDKKCETLKRRVMKRFSKSEMDLIEEGRSDYRRGKGVDWRSVKRG